MKKNKLFAAVCSATKGSSGSTSSGVKIRKILMADANSDGDVNTVDSLCILQASSGKITLSGDAEIAADIDRDGRISNLDALKQQMIEPRTP